jgi:hypothetical protein
VLFEKAHVVLRETLVYVGCSLGVTVIAGYISLRLVKNLLLYLLDKHFHRDEHYVEEKAPSSRIYETHPDVGEGVRYLPYQLTFIPLTLYFGTGPFRIYVDSVNFHTSEFLRMRSLFTYYDDVVNL